MTKLDLGANYVLAFASIPEKRLTVAVETFWATMGPAQ